MAHIDLKDYARQGAEVRVQQLLAELTNIYKTFPDLRKRGVAGPGRASEIGNGRATARDGARGSEIANGRSRRRRMSAAQRKAVSARMKKYWAQRRKAKAAATK